MKRVSGSMLVGAFAVLAVSSAASAQRPFIFFGGGLTVPVSTFSDVAKSGWMATGGIGLDVGTQGLFLLAEGYYGTNDHEITTTSSDILAGLATLGYSLTQTGNVRPYVLGGVGFLSHKIKGGTTSVTETEFAYTGAAGLTFVLSPTVSLWAEGRFLGAGDTKLIPVLAGLSIQLGN